MSKLSSLHRLGLTEAINAANDLRDRAMKAGLSKHRSAVDTFDYGS